MRIEVLAIAAAFASAVHARELGGGHGHGHGHSHAHRNIHARELTNGTGSSEECDCKTTWANVTGPPQLYFPPATNIAGSSSTATSSSVPGATLPPGDGPVAEPQGPHDPVATPAHFKDPFAEQYIPQNPVTPSGPPNEPAAPTNPPADPVTPSSSLQPPAATPTPAPPADPFTPLSCPKHPTPPPPADPVVQANPPEDPVTPSSSPQPPTATPTPAPPADPVVQANPPVDPVVQVNPPVDPVTPSSSPQPPTATPTPTPAPPADPVVQVNPPVDPVTPSSSPQPPIATPTPAPPADPVVQANPPKDPVTPSSSPQPPTATPTPAPPQEPVAQPNPPKEPVAQPNPPKDPVTPSSSPQPPAATPTHNPPNNTPSPSAPGHGGSIGSHEKKWAITYSPYRDAGGCKSAAEVYVDVALIASKGFKTVRLYSTDCSGLKNVGDAARIVGLKMIIGVFISASGTAEASKQVNDIVTWGQWSLVELIVVGNEAIFSGFISPGGLVSFISSCRTTFQGAGYAGQITTTEPLNVWEANRDVLCPVVDVTGANLHPFFNAEVTPEKAGDFAFSQLKIADALCPGHAAVNLETGWPSAGSCNGKACPGVAQQKTAIDNILNSSEGRVVLFTFTNDLWKPPGPFNAERSWGTINLF